MTQQSRGGESAISRKQAEIWGGWLGVFSFVLIFAFVFSFSETAWHNQIINKRHRKDWTIHTGQVTKLGGLDLTASPPFRQAEVAYKDFSGIPITTNLDLPYGIHPGDQVDIDVGHNGAIYVPAALDRHDNSGEGDSTASTNDPFKASSGDGFFPVNSIVVLGVLANLFISLILGCLYPELLIGRSRPRLPRRKQRWTPEELAKREKAVGLPPSPYDSEIRE